MPTVHHPRMRTRAHDHPRVDPPHTAWLALAWVAEFTALHIYWFLGGTLFFGDQEQTLPALDSTPDCVFAIVVTGMFAAGFALPILLLSPWGKWLPTVLVRAALLFATGLLLLRGVAGFIDFTGRETGVLPRGISGLTYEQVTGIAQPDAYTRWSGLGIEAHFVIGGLAFALMYRAVRSNTCRRKPIVDPPQRTAQ